jgi:5-methyltetrahydropteroyltriglutamate--homocysteine methyltransferase
LKTSQDRILTTHVGSLPRTEQVVGLLEKRENGGEVDTDVFNESVRQAVIDNVRRQAEIGIDVVSDGEASKISYATYVKDRLTGFSDGGRPKQPSPTSIYSRFRSSGGKWPC